MPPSRRRPGEVKALVKDHVLSKGPNARLTPYRIALDLGLSPGSVTAACKDLALAGEIDCHGLRPFMVSAPRPRTPFGGELGKVLGQL